MKKVLSLFLMLGLIAGTAAASDITEKAGKKTILKTSHDAHCSTPSGKASRECMQTASSQSARRSHL